MKISDLIETWEQDDRSQPTDITYTVRLPLDDAAKIDALSEMYPRRSKESLVADLLTAALNEFESKLPYVRGSRVVEHDEENNPLYEDIGPTPYFLQLAKKHLQKYKDY